MSCHRCPDCTTHMIEECKTCGGTRYVNRNTWGRITRSASPEEFFKEVGGTNVVPFRKPTKFPRSR